MKKKIFVQRKEEDAYVLENKMWSTFLIYDTRIKEASQYAKIRWVLVIERKDVKNFFLLKEPREEIVLMEQRKCSLFKRLQEPF